MVDDKEYTSFMESNIYIYSNQLLKDTNFMSMWHRVKIRVSFPDDYYIDQKDTSDQALRTIKGWFKYLLTAFRENILPHDIIIQEETWITFPFPVDEQSLITHSENDPNYSCGTEDNERI